MKDESTPPLGLYVDAIGGASPPPDGAPTEAGRPRTGVPAEASPPGPHGTTRSSKSPSAVPKLPEANEFSPGQVDLAEVLQIVKEHAGDREGQIEALRASTQAIGSLS